MMVWEDITMADETEEPLDVIVVRHLIERRALLLDELFQHRMALMALGIVVDVDEFEAEYEERRRKRGAPGRPTDAAAVYAAMRKPLFEKRIIPIKQQVADDLGWSEDKLDRTLRRAGTTFEQAIAFLSPSSPPSAAPTNGGGNSTEFLRFLPHT
jgi:hypothetical protein